MTEFSEFVIGIYEGKINSDTVLRFSDVLNGKEDRMLDSLSFNEEVRRKKVQLDWMKNNDVID